MKVCIFNLCEILLFLSRCHFYVMDTLYFVLQLWDSMVGKELSYIRDSQMLDRHPSLQPRMRSILLDWLTEVRTMSHIFTLIYYNCFTHCIYTKLHKLCLKYLEKFVENVIYFLKEYFGNITTFPAMENSFYMEHKHLTLYYIFSVMFLSGM